MLLIFGKIEIMSQYKIKDLPKSDRPREKLKKHGPQFLKNSELLAILIGSGYKGKNVLQLAKDTLSKYQSKNLPKLTYQELISEKGIGEVAACRILAAFELATRLLLNQNEDAVIIQSPKDVYQLLKDIGKFKKEHFIGLYLNARNQIIYQETISIGSLNANIVHPREVFEPAIKHHAAQVIFSHNHPSGNPEPSEEDLIINARLIKAGKILGIEVVDHIIITANSFLSFKEKKLI